MTQHRSVCTPLGCRTSQPFDTRQEAQQSTDDHNRIHHNGSRVARTETTRD